MAPEELQVLEDIARAYQEIICTKREMVELEQKLATALSTLVAVVKNEGQSRAADELRPKQEQRRRHASSRKAETGTQATQ
jgi:hypothetical protein